MKKKERKKQKEKRKYDSFIKTDGIFKFILIDQQSPSVVSMLQKKHGMDRFVKKKNSKKIRL
jgi:hypothetical protein